MIRPRPPPFYFVSRETLKHLKEIYFMKNRAPTIRSIDRKIFRNTASKVKAVNLPQINYRGGIRF